jgi:6-phosphogluconolactonase (cycloisomerase 2 family)
LAVAGCALLAACAGGGKDRSFDLPAGGQFDGARSGKVIVVVEAQNECGDHGACVTPPAGPCHLGDGNTRGLAIYRLGNTGLLFGNSAEGAVPEQHIALDDNPRRVVVNPRNPTILYVSTRERVQVVRLRAGGGSACIDETAREQDVRPDAEDMDPVDMVVDPSIGNGILYVATRGSNRVDAYPLAEDGTLESLPQSCIVGGGGAEFTALTPLGEGFFAAGGSSRIEIHARLQGQFLPEPDPNATRTATPAPTASPTPAPDQTPGPTSPSPERSTCFDARLVTTPLSVIGAALVNQLAFDPSASAPLGQLFIAEEVSQRIFTFPVNADGIIADNDSSSTKRAGVYQRMLRHRHLGQDILYSSVYNEGRVDAFRMENGLLPDESFSRTAEDPNALPVGLVVDDPNGTILYVAEGGLDRVDGFRIREDGGLEDEPVTSTAPPVDDDGEDITTFPDDLVIVPLP